MPDHHWNLYIVLNGSLDELIGQYCMPVDL